MATGDGTLSGWDKGCRVDQELMARVLKRLRQNQLTLWRIVDVESR